FYTHYHDPFDLLEQIENELLEDMMSTVPPDQPHPNPDRVTREVFRVIEENAELCKILFSENGDRMFLRRIVNISRDRMIADWQRQYPQVSQQQISYLYAFVIGGAVSVIEEWVKTGMKEMPLALGDVAQQVMEIWGHAKK
ncbi:MAG: TetR family transcriptional regulator C-terminal domain-containing protein, partial [Anaerolineae bacterium]|nr:TetR family transcriptional regulator C-terminal domain-containing protein [Anaerolineae bacterium]